MSVEDQKKPKHSYTQYTDTSGTFSNRSLTMAQWFLRHKYQLRKWWIILFVIINVVLVGYSFYGWGRYAIFDYKNTSQILVDLTVPIQRYLHLQPQEMQFKGVRAIASNADRFDFLANVDNPNSHWRAQVEYVFTHSGGVTATSSAIILPGSGQMIVSLGNELSGFPASVDLRITRIEWERINPHTVSDPATFIADRVMFEPGNLNFVPASEAAGVPTHSIEFDITNVSVYSFWEPKFHVLMLNNETLVGVQTIEVSEFRAGETRPIVLKSFQQNIRVNEIRLIPVVDVFDSGQYISPGQ